MEPNKIKYLAFEKTPFQPYLNHTDVVLTFGILTRKKFIATPYRPYLGHTDRVSYCLRHGLEKSPLRLFLDRI